MCWTYQFILAMISYNSWSYHCILARAVYQLTRNKLITSMVWKMDNTLWSWKVVTSRRTAATYEMVNQFWCLTIAKYKSFTTWTKVHSKWELHKAHFPEHKPTARGNSINLCYSLSSRLLTTIYFVDSRFWKSSMAFLLVLDEKEYRFGLEVIIIKDRHKLS